MNKSIDTLKQNRGGGGRNSTVEALRILAMFMILMVHANFTSIGGVSTELIRTCPLQGFLRIFFEFLAYYAVDLFVIISGWFGIHYSLKGLAKFFFQVYFFVGVLTVIGVAFHWNFIHSPIEALLLNYLWFILPYALLFITTPIFNEFINHAPKKTILSLLITFYIIQIIFQFSPVFSHGYSYATFAGLYVLARFINVHCKELHNHGLALWLLGLSFNVISYCLIKWVGLDFIGEYILAYCSPAVVMCALGLVLYANSLPKRFNKFINWVGASSFGVYLIHQSQPWASTFYTTTAKEIFDSYSGFAYLGMIFLFMCAVFAAGILLDQPRKWLWMGIEKLFFRPKA